MDKIVYPLDGGKPWTYVWGFPPGTGCWRVTICACGAIETRGRCRKCVSRPKRKR